MTINRFEELEIWKDARTLCQQIKLRSGTGYQVHRAFDMNYKNQEEYNYLLNACLNLSVRLTKFIQYLSKSEYQGTKKKTTLKP